jgi:hypothetical protein
MQPIGLLVWVLLVGLGISRDALADSCEEVDPKKSPASIFIPCIAEQAKDIAKLKSQILKLEKADEPLDDYILKVFLTEIARDKGQRSEYATRIIEQIRQGHIKDAFKIFSDSIGQEIDLLTQIKVGYQRPTSVQPGHDLFRTIAPKAAYATNFGVLVRRGQKLEIVATLFNYTTIPRQGDSPDAPVDPDPGFPAVELVVQCMGCKKREIKVPAARTASDFGTRDLTEEIDWEPADTAVDNFKFVELKIVPKPEAGVDYVFSAKFVVLVSNPIAQSKILQ